MAINHIFSSLLQVINPFFCHKPSLSRFPRCFEKHGKRDRCRKRGAAAPRRGGAAAAGGARGLLAGPGGGAAAAAGETRGVHLRGAAAEEEVDDALDGEFFLIRFLQCF